MPCPIPEGVIQIKAGSLGQLTFQYTDNQDPPQPIPLDNYEIKVNFIDPKTRKPVKETSLSDGSITILDSELSIFLVDPGDTSKWPLGKMPVDVLYINNGAPRHTTNFILQILKGNTL